METTQESVRSILSGLDELEGLVEKVNEFPADVASDEFIETMEQADVLVEELQSKLQELPAETDLGAHDISLEQDDVTDELYIRGLHETREKLSKLAG